MVSAKMSKMHVVTEAVWFQLNKSELDSLHVARLISIQVIITLIGILIDEG